MQRFSVICAALLMGSFQLPYAVAQKGLVQQQQAVPRLETSDIAIGQSLADVKAILQRHQKQPTLFAFARNGEGAEEIRDISFVLDDEHTAASIFYKVGTQQVIGISINLKPSRRSPKGEQFQVSARQITLHPDGSYSIRFEPPVKEKPETERVRGPIPTSQFHNK